MSNSKQYDYTVNALKGIFAIIIMINHLGIKVINIGDVNCINYVLVDAFFVFSGFFLASSLSKESDFSVIKMTLKRLKSIYPQYIFGILVVLVVLAYNHRLWAERVISVLTLIEEPIMLQQIAVSVELLNGPDWYVSVWIFVSIVYSVIYKCLKSQGLIVISAITFIMYARWVMQNGFMNGYVRFIILGGGIRGISVMGLGIITYCVCNKYGKKLNSWISCIFEIMCLGIFILTLTACTAYSAVDILAILMIAMILFLGRTNGISHFMKRIKPLQYLGNWSMYLYLVHIPAMLIWIYILDKNGGRLVELALVVLLMIVAKYIPFLIGQIRGSRWVLR